MNRIMKKMKGLMSCILVCVLVLGMAGTAPLKVSAVEGGKTIKEQLQERIDYAETLKEADYTPDSWGRLNALVQGLKLQINNESIISEHGEELLGNLNGFIDGLVKVQKEKTIKEQLQERIDYAETLKKADYTPDSWGRLNALVQGLKLQINNESIISEHGEELLGNLNGFIDGLVKVQKEKTIKEQLQDRIAYADTLTASDYTKATWDKMALLLKGIKANIDNEEAFNKAGEQWLSLLNQSLAELKKAQGPDAGDAGKPGGEGKITLGDGYYKVPLLEAEASADGRFNFTFPPNRVYSTALLHVAGGDAELTIRVPGYQYLEKIFLLKQRYTAGFTKGHQAAYPINAADISDENPGKSTWLSQGRVTNAKNDYYIAQNKISAESYTENGGYTDVTFPLETLSQDLWVLFVPDSAEDAQKTSKFSFPASYIHLGESGIEKLGALPSEGEYTWYPVLTDTYATTTPVGSIDGSEATANLMARFADTAAVMVKGGKANVTLPVKDTKSISDVGILARKSGSEFWEKLRISGNDKNDYDSIYSQGNCTFTFDLSSYKDLVFGKRIWLEYSQPLAGGRSDKQGYYVGISFIEKKPEALAIKDDSTGLSYETTTSYLSKNAVLNAPPLQKTNPWFDYFQKTFGTGFTGYKAWEVSVIANGENVPFIRSGTLKIPIPKGWDTKNLEVWAWMNHQYSAGPLKSYTIKDGFVEIPTGSMGVYILAEKKSYTKTGADLKNGTYKVNVASWHMTQDAPSMSDRGLISPAKLVVKDKVKTLYLGFQAVSNLELSGYMSNMWVYDKNVTYDAAGNPKGDEYSTIPNVYYRDDKGNFLIDDFNVNTLQYYPKEVYFTLPTDASEFPVRFRVPVMDLLGGGDMRADARFRIDYDNAEKISDDTPDVPIKEALGEVISIAATAVKEEYIPESWELLETADEKAKEVYKDKAATKEEQQTAYTKLRGAIDGLKKAAKAELDDGLYTASASTKDGDFVTGARMVVATTEADTKKKTAATIYLNVKNIKGLSYYDLSKKGTVAADTETDEGGAVNRVHFTLDGVASGIAIQYTDMANKTTSSWLSLSDFTKQEVDKGKLAEAISTANDKLAEAKKDPGRYDSGKMTALQSAIAKAVAVNKDEAAIQSEADEQTLAVNAKVSDLTMTVSRAALQNAVNEASKLKGEGYTPDSFKLLTDEIAAANVLLEGKDVTAQQLDAEALKLNAVTKGLLPLADKTELQNKVNSASAIKNQGQPGWEALKSALAKANAVLGDGNATSAQIQDALSAIQNAVNNLSGGIDKSVLENAVSQAEKLDITAYSDESTAYFRAALDAAKAVQGNGGGHPAGD